MIFKWIEIIFTETFCKSANIHILKHHIFFECNHLKYFLDIGFLWLIMFCINTFTCLISCLMIFIWNVIFEKILNSTNTRILVITYECVVSNKIRLFLGIFCNLEKDFTFIDTLYCLPESSVNLGFYWLLEAL